MANVLGRNPIFIDTLSSVPQIDRGMYIRSIVLNNMGEADKTITLYNKDGDVMANVYAISYGSASIPGAGRTKGFWVKTTVSSTFTISIFEE